MRISPIGVHYNHNILKRRMLVNPISSTESTESIEKNKDVAFKGAGGGIGSIIGTFAGIGIGAVATLATGGLAAPLIFGIGGCAAGGIAGEEIGDRLKNNKNKSED